MQFNGDTGSNYSVASLLSGDGSSASSFSLLVTTKRWSSKHCYSFNCNWYVYVKYNELFKHYNL
jgi:hypothetical protein